MVGARLPLVDALDTAAAQASHQRLKETLAGVARRVRQGSGLADSLARHPDVFGLLYIRLVRVGEVAGVLDEVLLRLADYLEKAHALRRQFRLALVYPAVVLSVAVGAVAFLLTVIVPTFADLFADFDAELPLPTRIVISLSDGLRAYFPLVVLGGIGLLVGGRIALRTEWGGRVWDALRLRLPVLGPLYLKGVIARFCRTLSTMLHSGVPLVDALEVAAGTADNRIVDDAVRAMRHRVVRGSSLAAPLQRETLFPPMVVQMIAVGEETARLDDMLAHVAEHYEREVDAAVQALTSIIEPLLILLLGLVIGTILVAIYLPMFDLVTVIE